MIIEAFREFCLTQVLHVLLTDNVLFKLCWHLVIFLEIDFLSHVCMIILVMQVSFSNA